MDEQPRLTDLVPTRRLAFFFLALVGLAAIAGLEGLYVWVPTLAVAGEGGRVPAFDLAAPGSLAVWLASMLLATASLGAVLVYLVRRHRVDDYHGRYRIWLWAAACWMLLSVDQTANLRTAFQQAMTRISGTPILGDGSLWAVIPYFFLLGAVGTRLLLDMRGCWFSSVALVGAALACLASVGAHLGWILPDAGARTVMLGAGAKLLADLLLLLAMGLHARHVILDAQGLIQAPKRKAPASRAKKPLASAADTSEEATSRAEVKVHPPHGLSRPTVVPSNGSRPLVTPPAAPAKSYAPATPVSSAAVTSPSAPVQRKLTKEERKALKKKLERLRREREE